VLVAMIYRNYANKKKVAQLLHKYMHRDAYLIRNLILGITELDAVLYAPETRNILKKRLQNADPQSAEYLDDPVQTRTHVYRFYMKGSNSLNIVLYYLEQKYKIQSSNFPSVFESDWDTSIIINPTLAQQTFNVIFDTLIPIIQKFLMQLSRKLASVHEFHINIRAAIRNAVDLINIDPAFEAYRKYPLTYKEDKQSQLRIFDNSNQMFEVQKYVESLRMAGNGLYVTSNRNGGVHVGSEDQPKFYLGRILASVIASRDIWLPIELLDVSINYQNSDLEFAWETYSEYHVQYASYDFRVSSPTCLYFDLSKCIKNANTSQNQTKKNKVVTRTRRLQMLLDSMIIPYKNMNNVIRSDLERHTDSTDTIVRNIRRGFTRKN
jgi:hypothetical protein